MGTIGPENLNWLELRWARHQPAPKVFVETGTGGGPTTRLARNLFGEIHTIEMSPVLAARYHPELRQMGIHCYEGDSAILTPWLAARIEEPVFWYLDAHWFREGGPDVAMSELPLMTELLAIAKRPYRDVIVVDDVNCFGHGPQVAWDEITAERIAALFTDYQEAVQLGDQFCIYR